MSSINIEYKTKTVSSVDIERHLKKCNEDFIPALDKKVNLFEYSEKIVENAVTFEAWVSNELVGLVAAYFNNPEDKKGYITNVSTLREYAGRGVGSKLLKNCIDYARKNDFNEIILEVNEGSHNAQNLYRKFNFKEMEAKNESIIMKLVLK